MGNAGEQLIRSCVKNLKGNIGKEVQVNFVVTYYKSIKKKHLLLLCIIFDAQDITTITLEKQREHTGKGLMNMATVAGAA